MRKLKKGEPLEGLGETFKKEEFVNSKKFQSKRDMVHALLEDHQEYTIDEVEQKLKKFLKSEVN